MGQEFRKLHGEREKYIEKWERTVQGLQKKDQEMEAHQEKLDKMNVWSLTFFIGNLNLLKGWPHG